MRSPLFRRLCWTALVLLTATGFCVDWILRSNLALARMRVDVLVVLLGSVGIALIIGFLVARSLTTRVGRLKRLSEGLPGGTLRDRPSADSDDDLASLERSLAGVATELNRLLDRLELESARREAILSGMAEGVLAVDRDLRVTFCNSAFLQAVNFRGAAFEGLRLLELARDPELHELLRAVMADGEPRKRHLQLSAANARAFEVAASTLAMPSGAGAIAILHDTTELERLEQVRKDFVANVSHELRTPLAGVIGYADTLLDGALEDLANNRRFVEVIRSNAVRLTSIASDLLVLAELESGTDAEPEIVSVRGVLESTLTTLESEARLWKVTLVREEIGEVYVPGSRLRVEQALLNLLANAIKFNRPGGEVRVRAEERDGRVAIIIADTGVGIPFQDLPRIFERFYRVDRARSRQVGGTGLGLSIVKHAIERMRGAISVESQLGKGSTFTVLLPAASAPEIVI
jgi:two-component system phosphate regulon sensor histidine kinase PhoR